MFRKIYSKQRSLIRFYSSKKLRIGIRREDKNCWERRVPLTPTHVQQLVKEGVEVYVEPSNTRCFTNEEYERAGAIISDDLTPAQTIFALKEVPPRLLLNDKTYLFFSHTIKAQPWNMPLLDTVLQKNIRLIDYEKITDEKGNRIVRFGPFAGYAGTIDSLHILGERLLTQYNFSTPFINCSYSKNYASLDIAKDAIRTIGKQISEVGFPKELAPLTFIVTGTGSVATNCIEILSLLPHKFVKPEELPDLWNSPEKDNHTIYICVTAAKDMVVPKDESQKFDKQDYYQNPTKYRPVFHEKILPYSRVILNAMYWDQRFPRCATIEQAQQLISEGRFPLLVLGDITCDVRGAFEFFVQATTISDPAYVFDITKEEVHESTVTGEGVAILGVDHLPAEFPKSSSTYFGNHLLKYVIPVAKSEHLGIPFEKQVLPPEIKRAVVAVNNELTPSFKYIESLRKDQERLYRDRKILLLGSGLVAKPAVDYLMKFKNYLLTIASADLKSAQDLCINHEGRCNAMKLDVTDQAQLERAISEHELVISLVPAALHPQIAEACIKYKKNMLTASYVSPEMAELDERAKEAGIVVVNELGLDPGIDHMAVMKTLDEINKNQGKVISFKSVCGAVPEPKSSNNAFAYKFSWSPEGVITAAQNPARFLMDGVIYEVPGDILTCVPKRLDVYPGFNFFVFPNRDSLRYIERYGLDSNYLKTMFRGTLRYPGFDNMFRSLQALGLFDTTRILAQNPIIRTKLTWREFISWATNIIVPEELSELGEKREREFIMRALADKIVAVLKKKQMQSGHINAYVANTFGSESDEAMQHAAMQAVFGMEKLGMLSTTDYITIDKKTTCRSIISKLLQEKLAYKEGEKDMVFMNHEFIVQYPNSKEKISSTMVVYGTPGGYTATAKTVGLPIGIAANLLLQPDYAKNPNLKGVIVPNLKEIYVPILKELRREGIDFGEEVEKIFD